MKLDLAYLQARTLLLPQYEDVHIYLIGCGGSGGWLAPSIVRIAKVLQDKGTANVSVTFIDPDQVEAKNVYRQNFCDAEAAQRVNKAETLAFRYGMAWGVEIQAIPQQFGREHLTRRFANCEHLTVLVGAVDNAAARQTIAEAIDVVYHSAWWLDCGNDRHTGQILLGGHNHQEDDDPDCLALPGYCTALPLPSVQHPELLVPAASDGAAPEISGLSCVDLAMMDYQSMTVNQKVAAEASDFLVRMLLTRNLQRFAVYFNLESGSTRSVHITEDNLQSAVAS
ncbi:MAG: ThiF family adenylyltransferase [Chloroflexota bacterium]|nr:ThiF family adenylyltransferase [Chloroflexota bacterium]